RLAYGLDDFGRYQRADAVDLGRIELVLEDECERRIDAGVDEMAGRVRLHGDLQQLPGLAERRGRERQIGGTEMALQVTGVEPEAALIGAAGPNEALLRERRGRDPGRRRPAGVEALVPGPVLQELEASRPGRERDALRHHELLLAQAPQTARGQRAPQRANEPHP